MTAPDPHGQPQHPMHTVAFFTVFNPFGIALGAIAGPLFILIVLIQDYTVPDYNPRLQPLSLLSFGPWGWVQIANFALAGALNLLYAVGLWRRLHPGRAGT